MSDDTPDPNIDLESISSLIPKSKEGNEVAREQLLAQIQDYLDLMAARHMDKSLQPKIGRSDIVQQTLTQVIENFDQFRGGTAAEFRGWLKTIVVNEMGKMRRNFRAGKRDIGRELQLEGQASASGTRPTPADVNPTPSTEAMAAEQIDNFYAILQQLPEDYAQVIRLRSLERLPFKEIADKMQRSHDAITKLWYRAVLKFEEKLKESGDFETRD